MSLVDADRLQSEELSDRFEDAQEEIRAIRFQIARGFSKKIVRSPKEGDDLEAQSEVEIKELRIRQLEDEMSLCLSNECQQEEVNNMVYNKDFLYLIRKVVQVDTYIQII